MKKLTCLLFLLLLGNGFTKLMAQQDTAQRRDEQLRQVLGMSKAQYKDYSKEIKSFEKGVRDALNDKSLDPAQRKAAIEKVMAERKAYQQTALTAEQRQKLATFERDHRPVPPYDKRRKALEDQLKAKGFKVKDSTRQQP